MLCQVGDTIELWTQASIYIAIQTSTVMELGHSMK